MEWRRKLWVEHTPDRPNTLPIAPLAVKCRKTAALANGAGTHLQAVGVAPRLDALAAQPRVCGHLLVPQAGRSAGKGADTGGFTRSSVEEGWTSKTSLTRFGLKPAPPAAAAFGGRAYFEM
jgi:hypothetical protein